MAKELTPEEKIKVLRATVIQCREFFDRHEETIYGIGHDVPMAAHATLLLRDIKDTLRMVKP